MRRWGAGAGICVCGEAARDSGGLLRQSLGRLRALFARQNALEPSLGLLGALQEHPRLCSILDVTERRCPGRGRRAGGAYHPPPPRARRGRAVPRAAFCRLRAERAPCGLSGPLQETRPPAPLPWVSSAFPISAPLGSSLLVWGCLGPAEAPQGRQQCARSRVWASRGTQDAIPAPLGAREKETGERASVCQTPRFYK